TASRRVGHCLPSARPLPLIIRRPGDGLPRRRRSWYPRGSPAQGGKSMSAAALPTPTKAIVYPESDGKPIADNTKQARWIVVLFGNLSALYRSAADVFVAADLFWYAVEGDESARTAPDVLVVFGRPKGDRGSYKQWEEDNVPPTVVFEILSPS